MNKAARQRQVYADLLARYGRLVADAFLKALDELRAGIELQRVMAAIENRDIEGALEALHIDPAAYNDIAERLRQAQAEGGKATVDGMPTRRPDGTALAIRFDGRNLVAEAWISRHSSDLITGMVETDRAVIRAALTRSLERGDNPRAAALDIVGRISRASGKRVGGVLGLSVPQAEYVASARAELASADPVLLQNYLDRKRIDRRFNRTVQKAIKDGTKVPAETAAKMITAYESQLLRLRGETIGRVETMTALQTSAFQAYEQAIASGKLNEADVTKKWSSAKDFRVRHSHAVLDGKKVGFREAFVSIAGARMQHPMDTSMGAGAQDIIGCRCVASYSVDWLAGIK